MFSPRRAVWFAIAFPVCAYAAFQFVKHGVIGDYGSGRRFAADLPHVGDKLRELHTDAPVAYSYKCHPHGGGIFSISGVASRDSVSQFCEATETAFSADGTETQDRELILSYFATHFDKRHPIHDLDGKIPESAMTLLCYGGVFPKLYGYWRPDTGQFAIYLQFDE